MELLSGLGKRGIDFNLLKREVDIEDTEFLSKYFILQEFSPTLTAGKNSISFNGSEFLQKGSEVLVECVDSSGKPLYIESTSTTNRDYKEASSYVLSIHVYIETSNGPGKLVFLGKLTTGETVRWVGNIIIDKTLQNSSTVRFYTKPVLEVSSVLSPVIGNVGDLNQTLTFAGSFYSYAVNPEKDRLNVNLKNIDTDYRLFGRDILPFSNTTESFNSQLSNAEIDLYIKTIQEPYSYKNKEVNYTASAKIKHIFNNSSIGLTNPIFYTDSKKNEVIVNVVNGNFNITYPYIAYNTSSESSNYLMANSSTGSYSVKQSYAEVIYRNLKTFSGFISRHKLYRKSLFSPGDFEVISDEPLSPYELLRDRLTTNKSFDELGRFYNQHHVDKYWYPNGGYLQLTQSSERLNEAMNIVCLNAPFSSLNSLQNYIIVKDNSSIENRDSEYLSFDEDEFLEKSGSSYDSNFIDLKKDVNYILYVNAILKKDQSTFSDSDAGLEFYFTSSTADLRLEQYSINEQPGLFKIGSLPIYESTNEKIYKDTKLLFSLNHDLYGTLVIVPRKCVATISNVSVKPYGDSGFSPDVLITRIPFPISVANESFEIKSELFDINSNLVFSDLRVVTSFDQFGDSLRRYLPGLHDPANTTYLSGSLEISQSLIVNSDSLISGSLTVVGTPYFPNITESTYLIERMLCWDSGSGEFRYSNIQDIDHVANDEVTVTLVEKNTNEILTPFRLLPSVRGKNLSVL